VREPAPCTPAELPELVAKLDAEFISGRGRSVSLATRFPLLFAAAGANNVWTIRDDGRIAAALVIRPFDWVDHGRQFHAAMIGMVWTEPALRGTGLASRLLEHAARVLNGTADFAVLWTAQPDFYTRLGWIARDHASFGEIEGGNGVASGEPVAFESVRKYWEILPQRALRAHDWQPPLPLPATAIEMFVSGSAYAIAGRQGGKLFCHEFVGDPADFPGLFGRLRASCATLYFNERSGSQAHVWLAQNGVAWQGKPLAMWIALRDRNSLAAAGGWYIPWLDRI
jgi:predicted N-acetyltransferase YhbS